MPVLGPMIIAKVRCLKEESDIESNDVFSDGCLRRFKQRYNIG